MPDPDRSGRRTAAIVAALCAVPGVTQAELVGGLADGSAVLRLILGAGADEVAVSTAVDAELRRQFGLRLDPGRIELVEESAPATSSTTDPRPGRPTSAPSATAGAPTATTGVPRAAPSAEVTHPVVPDVDAPRVKVHPPGAVEAAVRMTGPASGEPGGEPTARGPAPGALAPGGPATNGPATTARRTPWRPVIVRAVVWADPDQVRCEVVLSWRDREHHGSAVVPGSSVHKVVALATLRAVASILGPGSPARLTVVSLGIHRLDGAPVALVRLRLRTGTGTEWLVGASEVRTDPVQALVRATLDAVNRRLAPLIGTG